MNDEINGGPAFPMPSGPEPRAKSVTHYNEGMSRLDWFASQALIGMLAHMSRWSDVEDENVIAEQAYGIGLAMVKAGAKHNG